MIERIISQEYFTLKDCQNLILSQMQQLFLQIHDFSDLYQLFLIEEMPPLNRLFIILQYFCQLVQKNLIQKDYSQLFQYQIKKLQTIIQNHVKVEHQLRMYTELLETKLYDYKKQIKQLQIQKIDVCKLKSREYILQKQRDQIKRRNQKLYFKMEKFINPNIVSGAQLYQQQNLANFLKTIRTNNQTIQYRFSITDTQPFSFKQKKPIKNFLDIFQNQNQKPQNLNKQQMLQKKGLTFINKTQQYKKCKDKQLNREIQKLTKIIINKQIKPFSNLVN